MQNIISFLSALKENNNKEWFEKHKNEYLNVKNEYETIAGQLINVIGKFDKDIAHLEIKDCTYRIYRDVRFSKDKKPYKDHVGLYFVKGGKKSKYAGYYLHIEPGNCMMGGGIYMPVSDDLKKIRQEIYYNSSNLRKIINEKQFKALYGDFDASDKMMRPPKDFPKDFSDIDLLMYRGYFVMHPLTLKQLNSEDALNTIAEKFKLLKPLNDFFNNALDF